MLLRHKRALIAGATCTLLLVAPGPPVAAQSTQSHLNRARRDANRVKSDLERIAEGYGRAADARHLTEEKIYRTNQDIAQTRSEMGDLQSQLKDRVRALYKMGGGLGFFQAFLEAGSMRDASIRIASIQRQASQDEDLILKLRRKRAELQGKQSDLAAQREVLGGQVEDYRAQARRATISLQQANELVSRLKDQLSREQIASLFRIRKTAAASGGRVISMSSCALDPPHVVTNSWGAPRDGGRRRHQGNDIMADFGVPVRAVNDGTISRTGSGGAGGNSIYLFDGSASFYYAHLQRVSVSPGQKVSAGQQIGTNGNSGNAVGGPPHVHFEIHPGGGAAIDPYASLTQVC